MHRVTYVSNLDAQPQTRKFKTEKAAAEAWKGMTGSMVRYAVWVELSTGGMYDTIKTVRAEYVNRPL